MATSTFTYATQTNFKDYFPHLVGSDNKSPVYNWSLGLTNWYDSTLDCYYANNTGLVSQLFWDGAEVDNLNYPTSANTTLNNGSNLQPAATSFTVSAGHSLQQNDIIKIDNEYMRIVSVSTNDITVSTPETNRGLFGSAAQMHTDSSNVYRIINANTDLPDATSADPDGLGFVYDSELDLCLLTTTDKDPNDYVIESGTDYKTFMDNQLYRASMELNNMLDNRFPNPIPKSFIHSDTPSSDTAEYDAILVKLTCYIVAVNLQRASGNWEEAEVIQEQITNLDGTGMVDKLNKGEWKLSFETDKTDSSGDIIEITNAGSMNLVETYGEWNGIKYDRVQMICTSGGAYGTARMTIKVSDGTNLYGTEMTDWKVTGGLDHVASGLYVRFEGNSMNTNDRWDIEVRNYGMKQSNSQGVRTADIIRNDLQPARVVRHKLGKF